MFEPGQKFAHAFQVRVVDPFRHESPLNYPRSTLLDCRDSSPVLSFAGTPRIRPGFYLRSRTRRAADGGDASTLEGVLGSAMHPRRARCGRSFGSLPTLSFATWKPAFAFIAMCSTSNWINTCPNSGRSFLHRSEAVAWNYFSISMRARSKSIPHSKRFLLAAL